MSDITSRFAADYDERIRGFGGGCIVNVIRRLCRDSYPGLCADDIIRRIWSDGPRGFIGDLDVDALVEDIERRRRIACEALFGLLAGCKHSEIVRVPGDDPKAYEAMDDWNGRVNFTRRVFELFDEEGAEDSGYDLGVLSRDHGLDLRRVHKHISLGLAMRDDPELGFRLAQSNVPVEAFFNVFNRYRYVLVKARLHEAWAAQ